MSASGWVPNRQQRRRRGAPSRGVACFASAFLPKRTGTAIFEGLAVATWKLKINSTGGLSDYRAVADLVSGISRLPDTAARASACAKSGTYNRSPCASSEPPRTAGRRCYALSLLRADLDSANSGAVRMIRTYSKSLLSPFIGVVQVAETPRARALSLDGKRWAIQYSLAGQSGFRKATPDAGPDPQFALVASIEGGEVQTRGLHPFLDPPDVKTQIDRLLEVVTLARLPFAAADRYQYWLLDGADETPLALLHSCVYQEEMAHSRPQPQWQAMPAAQLGVPAPEEDATQYVPPVNYRLQKLVEERAGARPRAAWFDRSSSETDRFPHCLIREDWDSEQARQLCGRYIQRLAPRLLMLQALPRAVRQRLERAARPHVFDMDRFHLLYPEVVDGELLAAARVEARLRRAAGT